MVVLCISASGLPIALPNAGGFSELLGIITCMECKVAASCYRYRVVCLHVCVCLLDTTVSLTTAKPVEMPFLWILMDPRNPVLGGSWIPSEKWAIFWVVAPWKCIRLRGHQTSEQHRASDLSIGDSASQQK